MSRSLESLEKENDDSKVSEQAHCILRGRGGGDRKVGSQHKIMDRSYKTK